jgi:hypothetical protein
LTGDDDTFKSNATNARIAGQVIVKSRFID